MRRKTTTQKVSVSVSATVAQMLGPNPLRKAFVISRDANQRGITFGQNDQIVAGQGPYNFMIGTVETAQWSYTVTDDDIGTAIANPWFIIANGGTSVLEILEVCYESGEVEPAF